MSKAAASKSVKKADLLIELGCEELPPKSLPALGNALLGGFSAQLEKAGLSFDASASRVFYTPRRLALLMSQVADCQPHQVLERKGPALSAAFATDGSPTPAATGFARSVGKPVDELDVLKTEQGEWLFCKVEKVGETLASLLFGLLETSMTNLPVARPMRWANNDFSFIRPVHWLLVLYGDKVIEGNLYGLAASNTTRGHRIHSPGPHVIDTASDYVAVLESAFVLADQDIRKNTIKQQASTLGATDPAVYFATDPGDDPLGSATDSVDEPAVGSASYSGDDPAVPITSGSGHGDGLSSSSSKALIDESLLEEVSNLVEWPCPVMGSFDRAFLDVPAEALIASMQDHQKFFPVVDTNSGELLARFIAIANIDSKNPEAVREGFERVIRPRLADARFFWDQDNKEPIENWLPRLDSVVFQNKLGSIGDKSRRISDISKHIAEEVGVDVNMAKRAARLAKADLVSQMVGEFPELQGTMGGYYAANSGENPLVALAIAEHYQPAFSGDQLPSDPVGKVVAVADRLDTLVGIFATGLKPSGNKDPFALRRAALGLIHILLDGQLQIDLDKLLALGAKVVSQQLPVSAETLAQVRQFILERLKNWLCDQGYPTKLVNAVLDAPLSTLPDLVSRLDALQDFMALEVSARLANENKRIGNILRKSELDMAKAELDPVATVDENLLIIEEERNLFKDVSSIFAKLNALYAIGDYQSGLGLLAALSGPVEAFFDNVMVMDEDSDIRQNRLNLLASLKSMFDRVANLAEAA